MSSFYQAISERVPSAQQLQQFSLFVIQQSINLHGDVFLMSIVLEALKNNKKVVFIAFRENYAHYLSLSKKLGMSIEGHLGKNITYVESFMTDWCQDLPLTMTCPATYVVPPNTVQTLSLDQLTKKLKTVVQKDAMIVVDSLKYCLEQPRFLYDLYQQTVKNSSRLLIGGCADCQLSRVFINQADVVLSMQHDVGNMGKITMTIKDQQYDLLWKWSAKGFEVMNSAKL